MAYAKFSWFARFHRGARKVIDISSISYAKSLLAYALAEGGKSDDDLIISEELPVFQFEKTYSDTLRRKVRIGWSIENS